MISANSVKTDYLIKDISSSLLKISHVRAIILIGSYARNDTNKYSDIDLVVITDKYMPRSELYAILPSQLNVKELSIIPYPSKIFTDLYFEGSLFTAHVLNEGKVLYDDGYYNELKQFPFSVFKKSLLLQLKILKQRTELYNDLSMYGEIFTDCLSHLYSILKNVALIALALRGELVFNKFKAIERFSFLFPELEEDINDLAKLVTFSLIWSKGAPIPKPFKPIHCKAQTETYLNKLQKIISVVEMNEFGTKN